METAEKACLGYNFAGLGEIDIVAEINPWSTSVDVKVLFDMDAVGLRKRRDSSPSQHLTPCLSDNDYAWLLSSARRLNCRCC